MKKSPLDRVGSLFTNVFELGKDFEKVRAKRVIDPNEWLVYRPFVEGIRKEAASFVKWHHRTSHKEIADLVQEVWKISQKILHTMESSRAGIAAYSSLKSPKAIRLAGSRSIKSPSAVNGAAYSSFFPDLYSLGRDGYFAVKAAKEAREKAKEVNPFTKEPKATPAFAQPQKAKPGRKANPKRKIKGSEKIIASLVLYHKLEGKSVLEAEPIPLAALVNMTGVSKSTASRFFKDQFGGYAKYTQICQSNCLAQALNLLDGNVTPKILFNRLPNPQNLKAQNEKIDN